MCHNLEVELDVSEIDVFSDSSINSDVSEMNGSFSVSHSDPFMSLVS